MSASQEDRYDATHCDVCGRAYRQDETVELQYWAPREDDVVFGFSTCASCLPRLAEEEALWATVLGRIIERNPDCRDEIEPHLLAALPAGGTA